MILPKRYRVRTTYWDKHGYVKTYTDSYHYFRFCARNKKKFLGILREDLVPNIWKRISCWVERV